MMGYGMPEGFAELLARKYEIMQQQADAGTRVANASAGLDTVRAGLMPAESKAQIGQTVAQTGLIGQQAKLTGTQNQWFGKTAQAQIGLIGAQARESGANAGLIGARTTGENQINQSVGFGALPALDQMRRYRLGGY